MTYKELPREITSYDLFKTFAVISMVADHVGYYFYPDEMWWRVAGRLCVPVWFFLIGYARSRDIGPRLWIGAGILVAANIIAGMTIFPLNILATMIVVRLSIDVIMDRALVSKKLFWPVMVVLLAAVLPTSMAVEYGSQAILMAAFGYLVRWREQLKYPELVSQYFVFALATFVFTQAAMFAFSETEALALSFGILTVMGGLFFFRPVTYPRLTAGLGPLAALFRFTGRYTLEIYVAHLILFKAALLLNGRLTAFDWKLITSTGM